MYYTAPGGVQEAVQRARELLSNAVDELELAEELLQTSMLMLNNKGNAKNYAPMLVRAALRLVQRAKDHWLDLLSRELADIECRKEEAKNKPAGDQAEPVREQAIVEIVP